jgi:hypothetical protein
MKKSAPYLLLALLAFLLFVSRTCRTNHNLGTRQISHTEAFDPEGLDRHTSILEYTRHARCRMDCRNISEQEVRYILENGQVNYAKSGYQSGYSCPAYALEGYSRQRQHLRIVFAQCDGKTRVVTCIDLDHDFECHCPGDEYKR